MAYHMSPTVAASYSSAMVWPSFPPSERIFVNLSGLRKLGMASLRKMVCAFGLTYAEHSLARICAHSADQHCRY